MRYRLRMFAAHASAEYPPAGLMGDSYRSLDQACGEAASLLRSNEWIRAVSIERELGEDEPTPLWVKEG